MAETATPTINTLGGCRVLCLMAAKAEFGAALAARINPHFIGVGPIEAAINTTSALAQLAQRDALPDLVVSLGSAGSRRLQQTQVYQVARVSWRDMDASVLGFERGCTPFLNLPAELPLPVRLDGLAAVSLSTGAKVVSGADYDAIPADMVDMETYAVLRACMGFNVPLSGLRGVSDGADELRQYSDWSDCLPIIDSRLAEAIDTLTSALGAGSLLIPPRLPL